MSFLTARSFRRRALACLCLAFSLPVILPLPGLAGDPPTINDLLRSGQLDPSYAEDGVLPEAPKPLPPEEPESAAADSRKPEPAASPSVVKEPASPFADRVIQIGRPPYISVKGMMLAVRGLVGFLRQETGAQDVRLVTPKDYAGVLTALEHGAVDFAWLGPTAYVIGSEKMPLIPLAKAKRRTGGSYYGVIVTRKDSGISRLEEIRGKTIGFVDPESASGYLYPLKVLLDSGVDPQKDCKAVFLQKHDAVLSAVWSKKIDVGAVIEDSIAGIHDQKILDQLLVLGKTTEIPTDIVACRKDCDPVLREAFRKALLKTGTLKQASLASSGLPPIMEFLPVNDDDIARVRTFLNELRNAGRPQASR